VASITLTINDGDTIEKDIVHMSMPPTLEAMSYQTTYAYGNHTHVSSVEKHLTNGCGVVATFEHECISCTND
jgi:hypothetical protein